MAATAGRLHLRSSGDPIARVPKTHLQKDSLLSSFNAETAAALGGPEWLRRRREAAAERFAASDLPTPDEEVWRYSLVSELDLGSWTPVGGTPAPSRDRGSSDEPDLPVATGVTVDVIDGVPAIGQLPPTWVEKGVVVAAASQLDEAQAGLGSVAGDGPDVFATLNDAFALDPIVVTVPRGVRLAEPILITNRATAAGNAVFPRLVVQVGEGADVTIVDRIVSDGDHAALSVPLTELRVARGGRLGYLHVQDMNSSSWQVGSLVADVAQEATLAAALVGLGGHYARLRTDCRMSGRGAHGDLYAAYFGDGDQTLDFRTFQHHDAPDTTSNLLFKGAVGGRSRSIYTGLIKVAKEARGTNAFQTNRNVKLSDTAWAESVPNLEIETNDVRCSHASTVGPVDPEQRFYLESRGVRPADADRLILIGFFDEVMRALPAPELVEPVRVRIANKLDGVAEDLR